MITPKFPTYFRRSALCLSVIAIALSEAACSSPKGASAPTDDAGNQAKAEVPAEDPYTTLPEDKREAPPEVGPSPDFSFPVRAHAELGNALRLTTIERRNLPIVEIRLTVLSGESASSDKPGLANLTGEAIKIGGSAGRPSQLVLGDIEGLGAQLTVSTERDATHFIISTSKDHLSEAMKLLADVVLKPSFDNDELRKLKRREMDRIASLTKSSARWVASRLTYRELFKVKGVSNHPYSNYDASEAQLDKLTSVDVKSWHKNYVTPDNSILQVTGDLSADELKELSDKYFGAWRGKAAKSKTIETPDPLSGRRILLLDRPDSPQAEIRLSLFGPTLTSEDYVALDAADHILGGGVSGRLFADVREKRSLAYSTYSAVIDYKSGPSVLILTAGTQTAKAGLALQALFENLDAMAKQGPSDAESNMAKQYLADAQLLSFENIAEVGQANSRLSALGLSDSYYDDYRNSVKKLDTAQISASAKRYYRGDQVIATIVGDAKRLAEPLSHFGDVEIYTLDDDLKLKEKLPKNPDAKIELERIDGT